VINYSPQTDPQPGEDDLGDLLLEVLPPDGSTMGNLSAREALSRAAERPISEEDYEVIRDKALALGLVRKGRDRKSVV
jgi:adenine-specific DNA-methyltransferase